MKRFLILGSNSFSGSHFCHHLLQNGYEVMATSRSGEAMRPFLPYRWQENEPPHLTFEQLDINQDIHAFMRILKEYSPHFIVNFAAQSMVSQSWEHPVDWVNTNVLAMTNLIDALTNYDGLEKFVQITTPEVYGSTTSLISENAMISPSTPYAVSRAAGDLMLKAYHEHCGLPVNFTRAANVYGPGQQLYRIVPRTILACLTGQKLTLDGGGTSKRAFIHITDVCKATLDIALSAKAGETFHISPNTFVSVRQLVDQIVEMTGADFNEVVTLGEERRGKDQAYFLNSEKVRIELDWEDSVPLVEGLTQTVSWVKEHLEIFQKLELGYVHKP
jgi:dTDP-glucose 4,6-dehydratase